MMKTPPRAWTEDEDDVIREERTAGSKTWAHQAASRLFRRTPQMCWSRDKTMRDRESIGEYEPGSRHRPWNIMIPEETHLDRLVEAGGFPRFKIDPSTGRMTPELVDPWGYPWRPA